MLKLNIKTAAASECQCGSGGRMCGKGSSWGGHAPDGNIKMTSINTPINHRAKDRDSTRAGNSNNNKYRKPWQTEHKRRRSRSGQAKQAEIWRLKVGNGKYYGPGDGQTKSHRKYTRCPNQKQQEQQQQEKRQELNSNKNVE